MLTPRRQPRREEVCDALAYAHCGGRWSKSLQAAGKPPISNPKTMQPIPPGKGTYPVSLIVVAVNDLVATSAFYGKVFGWQVQPMSAELATAFPPAGPGVAFRANAPAGTPAVVPYLLTADVDADLKRAVEAGGEVEKAPWSIPGTGKLARFKEPSGTVYGLTTIPAPFGTPPTPMPFGDNPKPPAATVCSLEMHSADRAKTAAFFGNVFGWGCKETMPRYTGFDPGAGIPGVLQDHTPATPAMLYVYVPDVAAKLDEIDAAGGKRSCDAMTMPGMGTFGYYSDPSSVPMGLIGPAT